MTVLSPRTDYHQIAAHARWELQRLADHNRADMDAFTEWAGEQDLWPEIAALFDQAQAELDATAAEMRAKYGYASEHAELVEPDTVVVVAVQITDEQAELIRRREQREATLTALVENNRPLGWTPRPEDFAPAPDDTLPGREALTPRSQVQAGPWWRRVVDTLADWSRL